MSDDVVKHSMCYGLVVGAVYLLSFVMVIFGLPALPVDFVLLPYVLYRLVCHARATVFEGQINYMGAVRHALRLCFYGTILAVLFYMLYLKYVNPDFYVDQLQMILQKVQLPEANQEVLDELMQLLRDPITVTLCVANVNIIWGAILSLIVAIFVVRKKS